MLRHTATRVCRPYMSTSTSLSLCVVCIPPVQVADNQKNHKWPLLLTTPGRHRPVSIHRVVKALYTSNPPPIFINLKTIILFDSSVLGCHVSQSNLGCVCVVGDDVISKGRNCWGFLYIISIYVYCLIYYIAFCFNPLY
jgi:hypothetical protein